MKKLPAILGEAYRVVLVGTNEKLDAELPAEILPIHRTDSQQELAEIYSAADVFVNPTREDNYPTVNMEAIACGTPVVTFDTGGSKEALDSSCGRVVPQEDVEGIARAVRELCEEGVSCREACLRRAQSFDEEDRCAEYLMLFRGICGENRYESVTAAAPK